MFTLNFQQLKIFFKYDHIYDVFLNSTFSILIPGWELEVGVFQHNNNMIKIIPKEMGEETDPTDYILIIQEETCRYMEPSDSYHLNQVIKFIALLRVGQPDILCLLN